MKAVTYRVRLLEPALVTALDGDPNSAVAYNFLPGSVLRGAIIGLYQKRNQLSELDPTAEEHRRLFFDGRTHYLNGYLVNCLADRNKPERSLPTPLSLYHTKYEHNQYADFACSEINDNEQWQNAPLGFCLIHGDTIRLFNPARQISVHTMRDRERGRAIEGSGAVYRYDALAPDQVFESAVLCQNDADAESMKDLLSGTVQLGGSVSGGYGSAAIEDVRVQDDWREVGSTATARNDGRWIVTLLSDALVRDTNGQFTIDPQVVRAMLQSVLGCCVELQLAFVRGRVVGGFNRKWGLPLSQSLAVQMGSVYVFKISDCTDAQLTAIGQAGIGERRAEGFGRLAVNWHGEHQNLKMLNLDEQYSYPPHTITDQKSREIAKQIAVRMLRKRLDQRLISKIQAVSVANPPSNSQISRLRNIIRDELAKDELQVRRIKEYLSQIESRSSARKQFEFARVGGEGNLLRWIEATLGKESDAEWRNLVGYEVGDWRKVGDVEPPVDDRLKREYILRLIDGVLARAAKQKSKDAGEHK